MEFEKEVNKLFNKVEYNYNLSKKHNFFKSAGTAKAYYELDINTEYMKNDLEVISNLYNNYIPFKIFGKNTNLYITKKGYNGLFVQLTTKNKYIEFNEDTKTFKVSSNSFFSELVNEGISMGYDFSAFVGIPGLIGGAVVGNAGTNSTGKNIGKIIKNITVYNFKENKIEKIYPKENEDFFTERNSYLKEENDLKTKYLVLEIEVEIEYIGIEEAKLKKQKRIEFRRESDIQGFKYGTAGSFWSNSSIPKEILEKNIKFRDLMKNLKLSNLEYNGAGYTSLNCFLKTEPMTKDHDVAKLLSKTIELVKKEYNFEPYNEVQILDFDGIITAKEFINRYYK